MEPEATRVYITILIAGVIFCFVVIVFLITIIGYQKKSVAAYLETVKADLHLSEQENARIAFDMHDELNSNLSAVKLMLDDLEPADDKTKRQAAKIASVISHTMVTVRKLSKKLVPMALEREGLLSSIDVLTDLLFAGSSIAVASQWEIEESDIPQENKIYIYRIVQELLSNTIKHSHARQVRVSLEKKGPVIQLQVSDDGIGFNQKKVQKSPEGLGLRNVRVRVNAMKGSLYLTTSPGKGTDYRVELPGAR